MLARRLLVGLALAFYCEGAPCTHNVPNGLVFCSELSTSALLPSTGAASASSVDADARLAAKLLSGSSSCVSPYSAATCPDSSLSANAQCLAALKSFACLWSLAPARDWSTGANCNTSTLPVPSVAQCTAVFSTCNYTTVQLEEDGPDVNKSRLCATSGLLDFSPPVLSGCADIEVLNDTASVVSYKTASAVDAHSGVASTSYNPNKATPSLFDVGNTQITFSAVDGAGNKDACAYTVSVGLCQTSSDCNARGKCTDKICFCNNAYFGDFCEKNKTFCPGDSLCSGKGVCDFNTGTCECITGWAGERCNNVPCPEFRGVPCNGQGICHPVGVCQCNMGWIGSECQLRIEDAGMTSGELAGAVIGGMIFTITFLVCFTAYYFKDDSILVASSVFYSLFQTVSFTASFPSVLQTASIKVSEVLLKKRRWENFAVLYW
eukprot:g77215.t1